MRTQLQRVGKDLVVRIPDVVAGQMAFHEGADLELDLEDGVLTIRSADRKHLTLDDLLTQITPENMHEEMDWGQARGNELVP